MKNKSLKVRIFALCTSALLLTACAEESQNSQESKKPIVAKKTDAPSNLQPDGLAAPLDFTLTDLDGQPVNAADYRGKWLVLNYWATWCGPCRDEMPELVKFQAENNNVQILGIAYEDADVEKLKNFAADFDINYPLLTIDVYNPPEFAQEGGLGLPTTIVYTPEGLRHNKHMGPIDAVGLLEMIQP